MNDYDHEVDGQRVALFVEDMRNSVIGLTIAGLALMFGLGLWLLSGQYAVSGIGAVIVVTSVLFTLHCIAEGVNIVRLYVG